MKARATMRSAIELAARHSVPPDMTSFPPGPPRAAAPGRLSWRVRPSLLVALALSLALHLAWSLWPVQPDSEPDGTALTATLEQMPPPPTPAASPPPAPATKPAAVKPRPRRSARTLEKPPVIAVPDSSSDVAMPPPAPPETDAAPKRAGAPPDASAQSAGASAADAIAQPAVVLPPRLDLAYKVFFGTRGFMIGDATYRFEHTGDRYRISTIGQARGLAALFVRGTGKVESRGRITPAGLEPYEFAIERGSPDKREVAFFDWDARNVVLHDGSTAPLDAPAFDPLTILWQPYFSPPNRDDQTFSLATTRKVTRYTLSLEGEETIAWPRGEVVTQRWHRKSPDGNTEAWFWLAPSMHYIPIKMRVTRTSRGTLEALLDSIRTDDAGAAEPDDRAPAAAESPFKPWNPMEPVSGPDSHGQ